MRTTTIFVVLLQVLTGLTIPYAKREENRNINKITNMETQRNTLHYLIKEPKTTSSTRKAVLLLHCYRQ